ncbi:enoyl-CoA hydratase/isomerase family protein [Alkalihalobacillus sp. R86527]|uniref:enoyl-CoA hydratase/isomerase family protein n=1 Tax=Alkalihalobacillus sp. R86527 TaxID=3093863 RepID=UPI00366CE40F
METTVKTDHLNVHVQGALLHLTLNRPEALNSFSKEMILGLINVIQEVKENDAIRVVMLSGAGRSFSAGGDVKTMGDISPTEVYEHIGKLNELVLAMKDLDKPIISVIHGFAAGAGFNLALASDIILAAEDSSFVLSFSQVGLISDGGGLSFLPRLIGPYKAKELFFSAQPITAKEAKELRIVNQTYPLSQLQDEAIAYAEKLSKGPSKAFGFIKKIADSSLTSSLPEVLEQERITQAMMVTTEDHKEGAAAFKEKRAPQFKGR